MVDEGRINEIQKVLNGKIKEANDFNRKINDMSRKSDMNDQEVRFLKEQIDKERRKSTADENLVKKLEHLLAEKIKIIDEDKKKESSLEGDLRNFSNALDGERKKSLADEATIRKLEADLKRKTDEANKKQEHFYKAAEEIKLTENEINFLRGELDNERRKSTVDQNRIRKFEEVLNDKEQKLGEY